MSQNPLRQCLLILLICLPSIGRTGSLALSFDDGLDPRTQPQASTWNRSILNALSREKIASILYVAGKRVDSPEGMALVRDWGNAGHAIANHTYSHRNFGSQSMSLEQFIADTKRNQTLLAELPGWTKRLRFPYLKEGDTKAKRDGFRTWMEGEGYKTGAVSIDASDWYYNQRYLKWLEAHPDKSPMKFRDAYLNHLWERARYYNSLAQSLFQRDVKHVLLLHTNAINAKFLPDVIDMFRSKGWELISPDEAYRDPLYQLQPVTLPAGESILWALAKQKGFDGLRYPAEDSIYEKPLLDEIGL